MCASNEFRSQSHYWYCISVAGSHVKDFRLLSFSHLFVVGSDVVLGVARECRLDVTTLNHKKDQSKPARSAGEEIASNH